MKNCTFDAGGATTPLEVKRFEKGGVSIRRETVVSETRVSVFINGQETVRLLALPLNIGELVTGFLFSECIIQSGDEILELLLIPRSMSVEIKLTGSGKGIPVERVRSITSGCGKGITFVSPLDSPFFPPVSAWTPLPPDLVTSLMRKVQKNSALFRETGGVHSASIADGDEILFTADDIGRHNAVDKVLGWMLLSGKRAESFSGSPLILATTGRLSSEIVAKAVRGRFPFLLSPSAPTSGAIQLGDALGITLIGFARGERFNVYTHPERICEP